MAEREGAPHRAQGIAGTWPPRSAAQAGTFAPSGFRAWSPFVETLREWVRAEAGAGRLLPWVPVAFGTGIAFYFAADHEPVLPVAAAVAVALCAVAVLLRRQKFFPVAVMIAAVAAGFAIATWKTARIAHGALARPMFSVSLTGFVETRDIRERTDRFVLRVITMESARGSTKLERVRLSVKKGTAPAVGSFVELKARLLPPLSPVRPGSYDFSRVVFFAVRALLALVPALTVGYAIKKWSAAAAFVAAAFYLLLSGAEVATQRSFFMTAVVLIAVMVDRRAITFRTLAVAALIVLTIAPEALVHPSFQMSFAATLGLVALVQIGMPRLFATADHTATARAALWGGREITMLLLASLIAGLATTPYAAFHFHRVTPYGVLANLAAMPVVSAVVMPAGLLGLVAMPFGFDGFFWWLMGVGIDWMIAVTQWVAALPGAVGRVPAFGIGPLIAASLGIVLLGLLRTPLRWSGAVLVLSAALWAARVPQPDILISADGRNVGVRGQDGWLHLMHAAKGSRDVFLLKEWLAADADARTVDASLASGVSCDDFGCVMQSAGGGLVAQSFKPEALADDCERAALIVTVRQAAASCAASVIDADRLRRQGAMALRRSREGFVVEAAKPRGIDRPWSPAIADESEADASVLAPRVVPPRAVDATPAEVDLQAAE